MYWSYKDTAYMRKLWFSFTFQLYILKQKSFNVVDMLIKSEKVEYFEKCSFSLLFFHQIGLWIMTIATQFSF